MCHQCCIHTLDTYTECAINAAFTHYTHTLNVLSTLHSHIIHIHWICINETWSVLRSEKMSIPESHQWGQIIINPTFTVFLHNKSSWSSQPLLDLIGEKQKNRCIYNTATYNTIWPTLWYTYRHQTGTISTWQNNVPVQNTYTPLLPPRHPVHKQN